MRGDIVYSIYGIHEGREKDVHFDTFRTEAEAEAKIERLQRTSPDWVAQYHNRGFVIRETTVETDFQIPNLPKPRDKYFVTATPKPNDPGTRDSTIVRVYRRLAGEPDREFVCEYERNYGLLHTFEPFRHNGRDFALISPSYTITAVLDLAAGKVIAKEPADSFGFCPVGFYVPDWWDLNDDSIIPGSPYWGEDEEWPVETFGFVWGCIWGDDTSWKVQYLDLSRIEEGIIRREERFGYVELATGGYRSPCIETAEGLPDGPSEPPHFISIERHKGKTSVTFAVEMRFNLDGGESVDWKRIQHPFD